MGNLCKCKTIRVSTSILSPFKIPSSTISSSTISSSTIPSSTISSSTIPSSTIPSSTIPSSIITWKDTVEFTIPIQGGRVIKVYDGDTITIAFYLPYGGSPLYRSSVRLKGIDTPEMKSKNKEEVVSAQAAQIALHDLIINKDIVLKNIANEKYGRILADVYLNDIHINQWMIDNKYAVIYDGGTKQKW